MSPALLAPLAPSAPATTSGPMLLLATALTDTMIVAMLFARHVTTPARPAATHSPALLVTTPPPTEHRTLSHFSAIVSLSTSTMESPFASPASTPA